MRYDLRTRTTTALIRRSFDTRWHDEDALDEYERRLDASRDRWAHPLVLPTVLLQVQLLRMEEAVLANNGEVLELENLVDTLANGHRRAGAKAQFRRTHSTRGKNMSLGRLRRLHDKFAKPRHPDLIDNDMPHIMDLMKEAHNVLKSSIQLLETLQWMERAVKLLIQAGNKLDRRLTEIKKEKSQNVSAGTNDENLEDELSYFWSEIQQYLDHIGRLCSSLQTDRRMSELKCRLQIDVVSLLFISPQLAFA